MQIVSQCLEIFGRPEFAIELCCIRDPVAVVRVAVGSAFALVVPRDRTDPNYDKKGSQFLSGQRGNSRCSGQRTGSEARVLHVVEVLPDRVPCPATPCLLTWVTGVRVGALGESETVDDYPTGKNKK